MKRGTAAKVRRTCRSETMISKSEAERTLARMMKSGVIERMPRSPAETKILLALAASFLLPRHKHTENEINEQLSYWLEGFTCPIGIDHVTFRRYLVDFGFLDRDMEGSSYIVNGAVAASVLAPDARTIDPKEIFRQAQDERAARKRAHANN
jgi:hypothetical protein